MEEKNMGDKVGDKIIFRKQPWQPSVNVKFSQEKQLSENIKTTNCVKIRFKIIGKTFYHSQNMVQ